ncbi:hypothetical protein ACQEVF_53800 [Nonomuraea polychroma]|uniref:hypothetical protein n=1 Tax=Nonomuraea polychroma TaxID=46176 RepID=UPI003D8E5241
MNLLPYEFEIGAGCCRSRLRGTVTEGPVRTPAGETLDLTVGLPLGEHHFLLRMDRDRLLLARADSSPARADLSSRPARRSWPSCSAAPTLDDAICMGDLTLTGPRATAERFLRLFPPPEPATVVQHVKREKGGRTTSPPG